MPHHRSDDVQEWLMGQIANLLAFGRESSNLSVVDSFFNHSQALFADRRSFVALAHPLLAATTAFYQPEAERWCAPWARERHNGIWNSLPIDS